MSLHDAIWAGREQWALAHGGAFPTRIYLSPKATIRALRASCGVSAVSPELIEHGHRGHELWTVKRFARDVLGMDWFEDTRLGEEAFRFE